MEIDLPEDLLSHYTVHHGRIVDSGPYEGEPPYAPMFHAFWMDGLADWIDGVDGDTALFWLGAEDIGTFPELAGYTLVAVFLTETRHVAVYPLSHLDEPN